MSILSFSKMITHVIHAYFWNPLDKIRVKIKFSKHFERIFGKKGAYNSVKWPLKAVILAL